jgi:hypothetical protein
MAIAFEFQVKKNYHFITAFAKQFDTIVKDDKVYCIFLRIVTTHSHDADHLFSAC